MPWIDEPLNILVNCLKADPRVTKLVPVADTHTPIVTFLFTPSSALQLEGGARVQEPIEIDMACATMTNLDYLPESVSEIPDEYLQGLLGVDDQSTLRSLNGTRVADALLETLDTPR